jgi:hypothetical protein
MFLPCFQLLGLDNGFKFAGPRPLFLPRGTSPPHFPYHCTGHCPWTLRSTSSTIWPMLISTLITTLQLFLAAAA